MYNYKEYRKMKNGVPTCGECKYFTSSIGECKMFPKRVEEHNDACREFNSHYKG